MFDYMLTDGIKESKTRYQEFLQEAEAHRMLKIASKSHSNRSNRIANWFASLTRRQTRAPATLPACTPSR